jgi:nitroimidazol reductase NimA-like FMN-containing flavoprotein (pyridoxamine 5'-phosphate oxidase superfamily)
MEGKEEKIKFPNEVYKKVSKEDIHDAKEIEEIIRKSISCRFGFIDGDEPFVTPAPFGYEKNAFYFHADPDDRKIQIVRKNNKVCFEMTTDVDLLRGVNGLPCSWMLGYRRILGTGRAFILGSDEEKIHGLDLIVAHYAEGKFVFPHEKIDACEVVKVEIKTLNAFKSVFERPV